MPADDTTNQPCKNIYIKQLMHHVGPEIANVPHVTETPFLQPRPGGGEPLVDLTTKNLKIRCSWRGLLPHLKNVLVFKGLMYSRQIITDERIRNVFVGSESYKSRSQRVRDDLETFNSLADLVSADYHLVIVKLGYLGYKNIAAAGALKEVLLIRAALNKPTWLLEDPNRHWAHSRDADVEAYIELNFEELVIEEEPSYEPEPSVGMGVDEGDEPLIDEQALAEAPNEHGQLVPEDEPPAEAGELSLLGSDQPDKKQWKKKRWH